MQRQLFSKRNGRGSASTLRLRLPPPPMSASERSAEESTDPWYVTSSRGCFTEMRIAKSRSEAIALACDMLRQRIDVTGVGPMLETGQQRIDAVAIRQIWQEGAQDKGIVEVVSVCPWMVR
jgi:hypothetical protein